jgi:hypothetical protein|tara:strand:- start:179 stop:412 length:234 start_codon:yes stop_codon:yes gene_type:complete
MAEIKPQVLGSIDVLVDYKKGGLTLEQAIDRFRKLTGLTPDIAEQFLKGMSRDNIVSLQAKREYDQKRKAAEHDTTG